MTFLKIIYEYTLKAFLIRLKLLTFKIKWRVANIHNFTIAKTFFDTNNVNIGMGTYGDLHIYKFNTNSKIRIGNYCSIGQNTAFIIDADHPISNISTYPFKVMLLGRAKYEALSKGDIIIDDDVWIGYGATIMSGVHIGQGAVVAAGTVVTKDVPPYTIVGGVPARIIKYRFDEELIEGLLKVDYNKISKDDIEKHIEDFYVELKNKNQLDWLLKK